MTADAVPSSVAVARVANGHVALVTLRRPHARNAIDPTTAQALEAAVDELEADPLVRAMVIAGEGPVFCAGADLKAVAAGRVHELATERGGFAGIVRRERRKPLIAAVDGPALAGGLEIVLACDLVVASPRASFGLPEVTRAIVAAAGGLFRLGRTIPLNVAMDLALTGEPLDAERAHALGLVNRLVEPGTATDEAVRMAERIAANAPVAVALSRRLVLETTGADDAVAWERSEQALRDVAATNDFAEGSRAFVEKRAPVWTGT